MNPKNYYQILQVDPSASAEVIEVAYRRLARMYHPDINRDHDAVQQMQQLNEAYGVLRNPTQRAQYDQALHSSSAQTSSQSSRTATAAESSTRSSGEADYVYPDIPTHVSSVGRLIRHCASWRFYML